MLGGVAPGFFPHDVVEGGEEVVCPACLPCQCPPLRAEGIGRGLGDGGRRSLGEGSRRRQDERNLGGGGYGGGRFIDPPQPYENEGGGHARKQAGKPIHLLAFHLSRQQGSQFSELGQGHKTDTLARTVRHGYHDERSNVAQRLRRIRLGFSGVETGSNRTDL